MSTSHSDKKRSDEPSQQSDPQLRAIAYSLDSLIPGCYLWLGDVKIRLGGSEPEETYPGVIHSWWGIALVLPGYRIYSTYQGSYDPHPISSSKYLILTREH